MSVNGRSYFGNGCRVAALNETGGREVVMYNDLSAHTAYLMAFYRHCPVLIERLTSMTDEYCESIASDMGRVSKAHI